MFEHYKISQIKANAISSLTRDTHIFCGGPCAVESYEQVFEIAKELKNNGANLIRAGAFKPRTSPYDFQGLGLEGLEIIESISKELEISFVSEITDLKYLDSFINSVSVIQVGSRSMYNTELLKELGKTNKTILLKRGISATYSEWLNAAEYIALGGNTNIIMCERGIRTYENYFRNTLDIAAISYIKQFLPVIVDLSHSIGRPQYIEKLAYASIVAGADGIMVEVHNKPELALCDGKQAISINTFSKILKNSKKIINFNYE